MTMGGSTHFSVFLLVAIILLCSSSKTVNAICHASEKQALMDFKKDLKDPSGRLSSWIHDVDCCKWEGVVCSDRSGRVIQLLLQSPVRVIDDIGYEIVVLESPLSGKISHSLQNLTHLRYLDLSLNNFSGIPIPSFVGSLRSLRYLNLSRAGFQGMVPYQLGNLSSLRTLSVGGEVWQPPTLRADNLQWLVGLSNLEHLDMTRVNLSLASNWLEVINTVPSLVEIHLSHCQLDLISHHLDRDTFVFHANFSSLTVLDLSRNRNFLGHLIPRWIFGLTALASLDLSDNSIEGPLPRGPWNLTSLQHLDLFFNHLNGSLPNELIHLNNLISLNLGWNQFRGSIPSSIANISNLQHLDLSYNNLNSSLPSEVFTLKDLITLGASGNHLNGPIPSTVGNCTKLEHLALSDNALSSIPSNLGRYLSRNYFGRLIPRYIFGLTALASLDLSDNLFEGPLLRGLWNLTSLKYLDLSFNHLNGGISHVLCEVKNENQFLWYLDLRENSLSGEIPDCWMNYPSLERINLNSNNFTGSIPRSLFHLEDLYYLGLGNNSLTGLTGRITFDFVNHE
nr:probable leucine-rich repeat receptor-like protein kinase At2g33170 [Coffea arabica]